MLIKFKAWWAKVPQRFKSAPAWISLIGAVCIFLGDEVLLQLIGMDNYTFTTMISTLFAALVGFGVFNNPTDPDNF